MQGDKKKGLSIAYNNQAGTRQRASSSSIQCFAASSQVETAYLIWGTQRFGLAPLESLRRWPHE